MVNGLLHGENGLLDTAPALPVITMADRREDSIKAIRVSTVELRMTKWSRDFVQAGRRHPMTPTEPWGLAKEE